MNINVEKKNEPKTEKAQPAPEPKHPFSVKPHQNAILLVPIEENVREQLTELFYEDELMPLNEEDRVERKLPIIKDRINLRRLREDDVIFTAIVVPAKMGQRKQVAEVKLKISKPVVVKGLIPALSDIGGEEVLPDFRELVDTIQSGCLPFSCKVSQDWILSLRSV